MIDPMSKASYYLECLFEDKVLAIGTCFFVERANSTYLITNWHNVTGKNPLTNEYLGYAAVSPTHFRAHIFREEGVNLYRAHLTIPLYDENNHPIWLEHPVLKQKVDVVAIKLNIPSGGTIFTIEQFIEPYNEHTIVSIRDDVYILGYPFGLTGAGLPIWKRASIASEPDIDIEDLPKMFVDTASRSGMSGSPVIYKERRALDIGDGPPGSGSKYSSHFMTFVGVYSGRIGSDDELKAQLGLVWKKSVIEDIIGQ